MSDEHQRLARLEKQMTVLHEVTIRIASTLDPEDVLAGVLDSLSQLVTYETARVYLVDPELVRRRPRYMKPRSWWCRCEPAGAHLGRSSFA